MLMVLVMLAALGLLTMTIGQGWQFAERIGRNERDTAVATSAAELALLAARLDLLHSSRSPKIQCMAVEFEANCAGTGDARGLCGLGADEKPAWLATDVSDPDNPHAVPVGTFPPTAAAIAAGATQLPALPAGGIIAAHPPQYIIEALPDYALLGTASIDPNAGMVAGQHVVYRITAAGFGPGGQDNVAVLQTLYRLPKDLPALDCATLFPPPAP